jgi:AcrR family transcriptional regulator
LPSPAPVSLNPRKKPRQARAEATLDAIFEATIQVLLSDGPHKLTTTRVAERAGVSVGTMYQYFPHKQALIYALNERYLVALAEKIEGACRMHQGAPVAKGVEALIDVYWRAKTERADVTRALYRSVADMDNRALIDTFATRTDSATTAMLSSAPDAYFADVESINRTLVTVIFGAVRNAFEHGLDGPIAEDLRRQLVAMCLAYLRETDTRAF